MLEAGLSFLGGAALRWLYDYIKRALGLSDKGAAWGVILLSVLGAIGINLATGGFAGIDFNVADPGEALLALGAAWAVIYGTCAAWFSVTKNADTKKK